MVNNTIQDKKNNTIIKSLEDLSEQLNRIEHNPIAAYGVERAIALISEIEKSEEERLLEKYRWHIVSRDGFPEPNKYGFWCKLWYDDGFFRYFGSAKVYVKDNTIVAWQRLTEIALE